MGVIWGYIGVIWGCRGVVWGYIIGLRSALGPLKNCIRIRYGYMRMQKMYLQIHLPKLSAGNPYTNSRKTCPPLSSISCSMSFPFDHPPPPLPKP